MLHEVSTSGVFVMGCKNKTKDEKMRKEEKKTEGIMRK